MRRSVCGSSADCSRPDPSIDAVTTRARFEAPPDEVWQTDDVLRRGAAPSTAAAADVPAEPDEDPGKRQGTSARPSNAATAAAACVKRITALERPRLVRFEVIEQHLGVERCVTTVEGSYEIRADGSGSEVAAHHEVPRAPATALAVASVRATARAPAASPHPRAAWARIRASGNFGDVAPRRGIACADAVRRQARSAAAGRTSTMPHSIERSSAARFEGRVVAGSPKLLSTTIAPGAAARETARKSRWR